MPRREASAVRSFAHFCLWPPHHTTNRHHQRCSHYQPLPTENAFWKTSASNPFLLWLVRHPEGPLSADLRLRSPVLVLPYLLSHFRRPQDSHVREALHRPMEFCILENPPIAAANGDNEPIAQPSLGPGCCRSCRCCKAFSPVPSRIPLAPMTARHHADSLGAGKTIAIADIPPHGSRI